MIKHIVMWKLRDVAEGRSKVENAAALKILLESLKDNIPEVQELEVGLQMTGADGASDVVLYSEFNSVEALDIYRKHPEHRKAVDYVTKICSERRVVDYEV
jgi:hypothetical protein